MKITLENHHFIEIQKKSYSLDHIFLLKLVNEGFDISELGEESMKIAGLQQGLLRKGLITDDGKSTTHGVELLLFLESKGQKKIIKKKTVTEFEQWYKTFPGTDTFTIKGKTFEGSRNLRQNPDDCRVRFDKILLEGEYTSKQLIDALNLDVSQKKLASFKENTNKLKYMQNSLTYLNQRSYEPYIELLKEGINTKETERIGATDI
jgi:hypothetical protein